MVKIRPMETTLGQILFGEDAYHCYHEFLMVHHGKKVESAEFSRMLGTLTSKYFGVSLKLSAIRHLWTAIKREYSDSINRCNDFMLCLN